MTQNGSVGVPVRTPENVSLIFILVKPSKTIINQSEVALFILFKRIVLSKLRK